MFSRHGIFIRFSIFVRGGFDFGCVADRDARRTHCAEAFNVFDTPNFAAPAASCTQTSQSNPVCADNGFFGFAQTMLGRETSGVGTGTQTSPSAGFNRLCSVGGPRSVQFALRLTY